MSNLISKINEILPTMHGWCTIEKATKFVNLILDTKPDLCIEIGVFGGSSLIPQAMALKENNKGIIYGIDPWDNGCALEDMTSKEHRNWWNKIDMESIYEHCKTNISKNKLNDFCKLIRDKSESVVSLFEDQSVDILHIDGNHSESLAYKDATLYLPKVKNNGYIIFDDIWWSEDKNYVTTRKAILYLLQYCNKIDIINNDCMLLQKYRSE